MFFFFLLSFSKKEHFFLKDKSVYGPSNKDHYFSDKSFYVEIRIHGVASQHREAQYISDMKEYISE